jgi:hypothetical protein
MGKSKAIRASVRDLADLCEGAGMRRPTVLNVTFRRSLARGAAADFPGGTVYLDEEESQLDAARHPVLTVLINSLARVRSVAAKTGASYEVVILDEWVSILEMLGGDLVSGELRLEILRRLTEMLRLARAVVVSDALLDEASLRVLAELLQLPPGEMGRRGPSARSEGVCAPPTRVSLVHYTHPIHADHTFHAYGSEQAWEQQLLAAAMRPSAGAVVVPCMTKAAALRLSDRIRRACPSRRVIVYVAGGERDLQHDMEHIHRVWREADVLIYSPVITAGCSFEVRGHFDECFLYAYQGTASPRSALQMVFRVRDLAARRIHVWVARGQDGWADAEAALRDSRDAGAAAAGWKGPPAGAGVLQPASLLRTHDALMLCHALREAERNRCFALTFWRLVHQTGARIVGSSSSSSSHGSAHHEATTPAAQLDIVRRLTARTTEALIERQMAVPACRDWQLDDLERRGLLSWCEPPLPQFEAGAAAAPPFAQEHPPDEWHVLFLQRLVVQAGWPGGAEALSSTKPRAIEAAVREAVASVLVLGSIRALVSQTLASCSEVWWTPGHDSLLQPLLVGITRQDSAGEQQQQQQDPAAIVLYVHTQSCRMTRNDLESDVAVRAVFGWAVADLMRQLPRVSSVRCIVTSADASVVWRGHFVPAPRLPDRASAGVLRAFDFERCRPVPLACWDPADPALTFDPAAHVDHVLAGEAAQGQQQHAAATPARVFAIRPVDPTAVPIFGGTWTDPRSMLQALLHNRSPHALWFETAEAAPVAIRCRPLVGVVVSS